MNPHTLAYDDRALRIVFSEGPAFAALHAHDAIEAVHGVAMAIGHLHREHAKGDENYSNELALALRGLQILASLAIALDLSRATAEVSA